MRLSGLFDSVTLVDFDRDSQFNDLEFTGICDDESYRSTVIGHAADAENALAYVEFDLEEGGSKETFEIGSTLLIGSLSADTIIASDTDVRVVFTKRRHD